MPQQLLLLAIAGAAGTLARYGLSELVSSLLGRKFPWSTLAVNLLGSLLFGLVWTLATQRELISPRAGLVILTGFMGAFTTFSTFAFESSQLLQAGMWGAVMANMAAQNLLGILAVVAGSWLAKLDWLA
ncbi:MAG: fluoride efflux transporter CrcB [Planctomycetales bacterium]